MGTVKTEHCVASAGAEPDHNNKLGSNKTQRAHTQVDESLKHLELQIVLTIFMSHVHAKVIHHSSIQASLLLHNYEVYTVCNYSSSINRKHVFNLFSTTNSKEKVADKHTKAQRVIIT